VHPRSWDAEVGALAGRQHGVVAWSQLRELGMPRQVVRARGRARRLYEVHRGVYAVGHEALTWRGRLVAAVYACGPGALASHRAAGALHGLVRAGRIEVTVPHGRRARPGIQVHRSRAISAEDRTRIDGIPLTSVARTLVDLADVLTDDRLAKAIRQAEVLRVFDLEALQSAATPGRRGEHRLHRALANYQPEPHLLRSKAERRLEQLTRQHNLGQPQFNVNIHGHEVDAYWPEANLVLEVDGASTHFTKSAFHADRRRDRALAAAGVQVIRVTWPNLNADLAEQLKEILRRR
jgi:very-short-patch-repair endonuclease